MLDTPVELPQITDEDIRWAASLLGLPSDAFHGPDGKDPRQHVIKSMEPLDVAAAPGSGKTTVLVAKLAILAAKWPYKTRGICVLSHTNAAREEIEKRLGDTTVGRRLLSYPHYVGTIHGFVNEYLAIPYLKSLGYTVRMIDTEITELMRWYRLPRGTRDYLKIQHVEPSDIRIKDIHFTPEYKKRKDGAFPRFTEKAKTFSLIKSVCSEIAREGYFCHEDMFLWAHDLIDRYPAIVRAIRERFPLLFIDEAQDNSEDQSAILYHVFMSGTNPVIRQRFGDPNQAIYDSINARPAETDKFPNKDILVGLPNSHRFGPKIAQLARSLCLDPDAYELVGQGPREPLASGQREGRHTIFLFKETNIQKVLNAYAQLLLETFSEEELRTGTFVAVGHVHRATDQHKDENNRPHHVGNYWSGFDPDLNRPDPRPRTFVQYIPAALEQVDRTGELYNCVEKIAEGILRLARMIGDARKLHVHRSNHRTLLELLRGHPRILQLYENLLFEFVVRRTPLERVDWESRWKEMVRSIASVIAGSPVSNDKEEVKSFLEWPTQLRTTAVKSDNVFRYPRENPKVCIKLGSIHSVKGKTHTATLVLETYWYQHNLEQLIPWLIGDNCGGSSASLRNKSRLKVHYVAMTRPTHLLCLAMKQSSFESDGKLDQTTLYKLKEQGWQIRFV